MATVLGAGTNPRAERIAYFLSVTVKFQVHHSGAFVDPLRDSLTFGYLRRWARRSPLHPHFTSLSGFLHLLPCTTGWLTLVQASTIGLGGTRGHHRDPLEF